MLRHGQFGDQIGGVEQCVRGVVAGHDDMGDFCGAIMGYRQALKISGLNPANAPTGEELVGCLSARRCSLMK